MRTTFFGYELARRALATSQRSIDVAGHNIANASTPGYSRQRVITTATPPYTVPTLIRSGQAGQVGTGAEITSIRRVQSAFLEAQARMVTSDSGAWSRRHEALSRLEAVTNEPGDSGLHALLDRFWMSWQGLSTDPASTSLRQAVTASASSLADGFNRVDRQIRALQTNADEMVRADVYRINSLADQLNGLNQAIRLASGVGDNPNDLLDQRDVILRDLAQAAAVTIREYGDGSIAVAIGGYDLVQQYGVNRLATVNQPGTGFAQVMWEGTGVPLSARSGTLAGAIEMRDTIYAGFLADLDIIADTIAAEVNAIHRTGFDLSSPPETGRDFFDTTVSGARGMRLSAALAGDVSLIAASAGGEAGDGQIAVAIARIRTERLAGLGEHTIDDHYRGLVAGLAVRGQEAERVMHTQELLSRQIDNQRSQESGVSLDEEMVELMKHQHVYTAAARLLTAMDEMVQTLIERTGAGR